MLERNKTKRILILGGSGFIGLALYRELAPYFDTHATYCHSESFALNQRFYRYDMEEDDLVSLLERVRPDYIISTLRGEFGAQVQAHLHLMEYLSAHSCRVYFVSSANVFDAYSKFPSYETDKTLSESVYGKLKIRIENMLLRQPECKMCILRVPMVYGNTSPRIREIRGQLERKEPIEIFPNLIINVTNDDQLVRQIHYLLNRDCSGIYHLGSEDLVFHEEFIREVIKRLGNFQPVFKKVFTTNDDRYLAALPKDRRLPDHLKVTYQQVIDHHIMVE